MIFFDLRFENGTDSTSSTVSIRKITSDARVYPNNVWAYEVFKGKKRQRGTVEHDGPEDFTLVSLVLADYVSTHGG